MAGRRDRQGRVTEFVRSIAECMRLFALLTITGPKRLDSGTVGRLTAWWLVDSIGKGEQDGGMGRYRV